MKEPYDHLRKHLIPVGRNRYITRSDPLYYEKVLRYIDPDSTEAHYKLGIKHEQEKDFPKAMFHYKEAAATNTHSIYSRQAKAAIPSLKRQMNKTTSEKTATKVESPLLVSVIITLLLLNLTLLLFLLYNNAAEKINDIPVQQENIDETPSASLPLQVDTSLNEQKPSEIPPVVLVGTNLVRTALQTYINETGAAPSALEELTGNYPANYLSFIPNEPTSGQNDIVTVFNGKGGWVYNEHADNMSDMFYPNITLPPATSVIPFEPIEIVISKDQYTLQLISGDSVLAVNEIGLGKNDSTPNGTFSIQNRVLHPQGVHEGMFGEAGLGMGNIALHGTYDVDSIKQNQSLGCVRLKNEDIMNLFHFAPKGTTVHISGNKQVLSAQTISTETLKRLIPNSISAGNQTSENIFYWLG